MNSNSKLTKLKYFISKNPLWFFSFISLALTLILNHGIFSNYIFLDATEYIWTASRIENFENEFIQGGRPLLAIYCKFLYGTFCNTISDLKWARLFSLVCGVLFSIQIFSFLIKLKMKIFEAAIFAFLVLTLPSFSVYFSWSATSEIPFLLNINFFAGVILLKNIRHEKNQVLYYLIPLIIIVTSLCIYQSSITAFLIPLVIYFIITNNFTYKTIVVILLFMAISLLLYYIIFKYSLSYYQLEPTGRTQLDLLELPKKIVVFYLREIRVLTQGSGLLVAPILFFIIGTIGFLGFVYKLYTSNEKNRKSYIFIGCIILVLPLSYLPNLLSGQNYFCSRAIAPTAILILFYQFLFFRQISIKNTTLKKLSLALVVLTIILSSINLNYYITTIQIKEYNALKTAFLNIPKNNKAIILVQPDNDFLQKHDFYKNRFADEFGSITSPRSWGPSNLFKQVWKEHDEKLKIPQTAFKNISVVQHNEKIEDNEAVVIDIVEILKEEFSKN